jgi:hypothetical protein
MAMCTVANQQIMEQVIREKVGRGEMFTAFEVSLEARGRGGDERHRHMKHVVHQAFTSGLMGTDYTRSLVSIPGGGSAWLFHRVWDDPGAFLPLARSHSQGNGHSRNGDDGYRVDRRARICIPAGLLRRVGLQPGDEALVVASPRTTGLKLTRSLSPARRAKVLARYRVDRYGNVRIAQRTLTRAQLGGRRYDLAGNKNRVTIRLYGD